MAEEKVPLFNTGLPGTFYRLLCSTYLGHRDRWSLLTALGGKIPSPVLLKHSLKPRNFFTEQKTVTTISIPKAPNSDDDHLKETFVSQLRNGRLIYCYPNGTIALYSRESPTANPEYFSLLPEAKTIAIHELPDERLLVTLKDHQTQLVDLKQNSAKKLNLPAVKIKSVLTLKDGTTFIALKNGKLIKWDLINNCAIQSWQFTATELTPCSPNIKRLENSDDTPTKGLAILCIALNRDGHLFLVLDAPDGYLTGLFNPETTLFQRLQFIEYSASDKIGNALYQIFYDRFGDLTLIYRSNICNSYVHVLDHNNSPPEKQLIFKANEDSIEREAFVLPSGCLAFSCYEDNSHDEEETDSLENSEEISLKGILEIQEFAPKI